MAKQLIFSEEARRRLKSGVDTVATAVSTTLGPKGRAVALDRKSGPPVISHDGVTVAREVELEDPYENMGARLLKEAASKTADVAGDGTTTATVIAQHIVSQGLRSMSAGANPMLIKRGIELGVQECTRAIGNMALPASSIADITSVATISAQDAEIGKLVAAVMDKVGKDGVITVEESQGLGFETEYVGGMQFDRGYVSPYFVTDPGKMEAVVEDAYILVHQEKISSAQDLTPILEKLITSGKRELVIVAEDVVDEALATLVLNKLRGVLNVSAVKAPGFGDRRKAWLQDLAIMTGAQVISQELGRKLEGAQIGDLGRASRVISTKDDTTIVSGQGEPAHIKARIEQIKGEIDRSSSEYDREKLQERLAKLTGAVAIIRVGAATDVERVVRRTRVEDAVNAARAAAAEGIVPGGGLAFLNAMIAMDNIVVHEEDERTGLNILRGALLTPMFRIIENAGRSGDVVISGALAAQQQARDRNIGFDVLSDSYVNMYQAGIVDPVRVARAALENAASISAMILTSEALITDVPDIGGARMISMRASQIPKPSFPSSEFADLRPTWDVPQQVETESPEATADRTVDAYAVARLEELPEEDRAFIGQPFLLIAGVLREPGELFQVVAGGPFALPAHEKSVIEILVFADGMTVEPEHSQEYVFDPQKDTDLVSFTLTPERPGWHSLTVTFYYQQRWIGQITFDVEVLEAVEPAVLA